MRKDRLYFFTFISITVIYAIIASITFNYLVKESTFKLLETHMEFSKKEAKSYTILVGQQLANGILRDTIVKNIQESLKDTYNQTGFLSIYNWSGKIVAHPDIKNVGLLANQNNSLVSTVDDNINVETLYNSLKTDLKNSEDPSKVIYLLPIERSDWILAANIRIDSIALKISDFKQQFFVIFLIMGLFVVLACVIILRLLGSSYEKKFELKNEKLENEVINLSKLNRAIGSYREKIIEKENNVSSNSNDKKKRILTYIRNELIPIDTNNIAYVYTENTITYVICTDNSRSTSNLSLDELFAQLDSTYFFRANRQFIIAISAINKIVKYGNNQLKILVIPGSETSIIISKNKAALFKQWLNT